MRSGLFAIGAIILVLGIMIVANDQPKVSAVESMFGGWAMLSPEYQSIVQELMFGYALAVIGIIIMIPGIILKKKKDSEKKKEDVSYLEKKYAKGELSKSEFESKKEKVNAEQVETPIEILKKRFAKGEITTEEFEKMKKDLENS